MYLSFRNFWLKILFGLVVFSLLSGCASIYTRITKGELVVETRLSESLFLDPLSPSDRVVYVDVRNSTGKSHMSNFAGQILGSLQSRGYQITQEPNDAKLLLQVNLLNLKRTTRSSARTALNAGYGSPAGLEGAVIGGATASAVSGGNNDYATVGGGVLGGILGVMFDANTQDINYTMVADVQLSTRQGGDISYPGKVNLQQGTSGSEVAEYERKVPWIKHRTRLVTTANKVNLKLDEAAPAIRDDMIGVLTGMI